MRLVCATHVTVISLARGCNRHGANRLYYFIAESKVCKDRAMKNSSPNELDKAFGNDCEVFEADVK